MSDGRLSTSWPTCYVGAHHGW